MPPLKVSKVDELKSHVGADLGVSEWLLVDQARIDAFAESTGDHQWIHVDAARAARESPFGGTVAHGYLTLSLAAVLLPQLCMVEECSRVINYGIDKLRMKEPVPAGSRIRLAAELSNVRDISGGAWVTFSTKWEVEGVKRPVCFAELTYIYYR